MKIPVLNTLMCGTGRYCALDSTLSNYAKIFKHRHHLVCKLVIEIVTLPDRGAGVGIGGLIH